MFFDDNPIGISIKVSLLLDTDFVALIIFGSTVTSIF